MSAKPKGVRATHPTYDKLSPQWRRCSDAVDGQDAMRARREDYLPKLTDEEIVDHLARIADALPDVTLNEKWKAINSLLDYRLTSGGDLVAEMLVDLILAHIAETVRTLIPREELEAIMAEIGLR